MRKAISMTMTLIVSALIILAAGLTLVTLGTNFTQKIGTFLDQGKKDETSQLRNTCLRRKSQICGRTSRVLDMYLDGGGKNPRDWAKQISADGTTCWQLAQEQGIFGAQGTGSIPECSRPTIATAIEECLSSLEDFCGDSDNSGKNWGNYAGGSSSDQSLSESCGRPQVRQFIVEKDYLTSGLPVNDRRCN